MRPTPFTASLFCSHPSNVLFHILFQYCLFFSLVYFLPPILFPYSQVVLITLLILEVFFCFRKVIKRWHHRARRELRKAVKTQAFYWIVILVVFLNSLTLALEHYDQPEFLTDFLGKIRHFSARVSHSRFFKNIYLEKNESKKSLYSNAAVGYLCLVVLSDKALNSHKISLYPTVWQVV